MTRRLELGHVPVARPDEKIQWNGRMRQVGQDEIDVPSE